VVEHPRPTRSAWKCCGPSGIPTNPLLCAGAVCIRRRKFSLSRGFRSAAKRRRPPLVVLAGDVGSGKTELAETIGDAVARREKIDITLLPLSLSTRGQGRVGEMTQLLSAAFDYTIAEATKFKSGSGKTRGGVILLVDEADALARKRDLTAACPAAFGLD
jgi:ATPase family associated with various cellular activities (AAA)